MAFLDLTLIWSIESLQVLDCIVFFFFVLLSHFLLHKSINPYRLKNAAGTFQGESQDESPQLCSHVSLCDVISSCETWTVEDG